MVPVAGWALLALGAALYERSRAISHSADHALLGTYGALALPLVAFAVVSAALGGLGMGRAIRSPVGFGAPPERAALGALIIAGAASALLGGTLAALVSVIAHGAGDPPALSDAVTSFWIGALGGATYAAYFTFGSAFGNTGLLRGALLVFDWLLGSGTGVGALLTPRGHVRNLFGGLAPAEISQRASTVALLVLAVVFGVLCVLRARRAAG